MPRSAFKVSFGLLVVCALVCSSSRVQANPGPGLPPAPKDLARATPQRSVEYFLAATGQARFHDAAYILDLRALPRGEQASRGAVLARKLRIVLDRKLRLEPSELSNEPDGTTGAGARTNILGYIDLAAQRIPIKLARVPNGQGAVWVFSRATVGAIDDLYDAYGPGLIAERLPEFYQRRSVLDIALWQWLGFAAALILGGLFGVLGAWPVLAIGRRIARRTATPIDDSLLVHMRGPVRLFIGLWIVRGCLEFLHLSLSAQAVAENLLVTAFILSTTWWVMRIVHGVSDVVLEHLIVGADVDADLVRHGHHTRVRVGRQVVNGLVLFVGVAVALTQFEVVREVGVSLLASAGVVGVVLGLAAQKSVGNLIAGIQISVAQPIRIGDRVHISGDTGWVEEITLTYVTMKTWDGRRRIFPITYFIENEFENWTKTSPQLVGQILLPADYRLPFAQVREKLLDFVREDEDWDSDVADVVLFDATSDGVVLRVTASSADAGRSWALRCRVRQKAVAYLQALDDGRYLLRRRLELPQTA